MQSPSASEVIEFKYDSYNVICPKVYFQFLKEIFILDVYRTNLLKENDLVVDLGAGAGDFSIIASKKVGRNGKVIAIEPVVEDYQFLNLNIRRNNCQNVIPVNLGVGSKPGEKEMIFSTKFFSKLIRFKVDTLENILDGLNIKDKINFLKMDIEGFEADLINNSINIIKEANVISLEFHGIGIKEKVDEILLPYSFLFKPITMNYIYKKLIKNLFLHPVNFYKSYVDEIIKNPSVISKTVTGFDMTTDQFLAGSYLRER
jgi:FkbM family methyltransferase